MLANRTLNTYPSDLQMCFSELGIWGSLLLVDHLCISKSCIKDSWKAEVPMLHGLTNKLYVSMRTLFATKLFFFF